MKTLMIQGFKKWLCTTWTQKLWPFLTTHVTHLSLCHFFILSMPALSIPINLYFIPISSLIGCQNQVELRMPENCLTKCLEGMSYDALWNTMISVVLMLEDWLKQESFLMDFQVEIQSLGPPSSGYCRFGGQTEAFDLFRRMRFEGQKPSQYTLGSILGVCSALGLIQTGDIVHGYVAKKAFESNVYVVTGLVDMYAKYRHIPKAEILFKGLAFDKGNHVVWTAMVTGYAQNGDGHEAVECFRYMCTKGVESNQFTFPSILIVCSSVSTHCFGEQVHGCIVRNGFGCNVYVQSGLVDMHTNVEI